MNLFKLRQPPTLIGRAAASGICLSILLLVWYLLTRGATVEDRAVGPAILPSPMETLRSFHELWFDRALSRNVAISLWRIVQGFGLAALIGVPLGIACGTWPIINALLAPITVFGRNVPMSALVPLTLVWFSIGETQKIMFIFIACVAFIIFDAAHAIASIHEQYVQTALTLGASKAQVIVKVLVPLALPDIFTSLRLLFGLAFGYIILAEIIDMSGGLGELILTSQLKGPRAHVYIILVIIALVAYGLDRLLYFIEQTLFPYREA